LAHADIRESLKDIYGCSLTAIDICMINAASIDRHEANNLSVLVPWERTEKDGKGESRREEREI
jgi:hypothetical protein